MQCRRYLCSTASDVLITLLSVTVRTARWRSPNGSSVTEQDIAGLDYCDARRPGLGE